MMNTTAIRRKSAAALLLGGLFLASTAGALEVFLRTGTTSIKGLPTLLPDGTVALRDVEMWGFARDSALGANDGTVTVPGPALEVPALTPVPDTTLVIHLTNTLPEPVSIVIPNQNGFVRDAAHTEFTDAQSRVRAASFVKEAPAPLAPATAGTPVTYVWNNLTPGTYLYYSGSHSALQVQMGLYGALTVPASPTEAYPGISSVNQISLLFSEIDVDVHDAVAAGTYGTTIKSMIHSVPEYFLINGEAYEAGQMPVAAGVVGQMTLLRLLNACADTRVPVLNGHYLTLVAEDGRLAPFPRDAAAVDLPALKTCDALFTPSAAGTVMLYDRRLGLTNGAVAGDGGMYKTLTIAP